MLAGGEHSAVLPLYVAYAGTNDVGNDLLQLGGGDGLGEVGGEAGLAALLNVVFLAIAAEGDGR